MNLETAQPIRVYVGMPGLAPDQERKLLVETNRAALDHMRAVSPDRGFGPIPEPGPLPEPDPPVRALTVADVLRRGAALRDQIVDEVCKKHGLMEIALRRDVRYTEYVHARWETFYRLHTELGMSQSQIARYFNRDHSTIHHGLRKYEEMLREAAE